MSAASVNKSQSKKAESGLPHGRYIHDYNASTPGELPRCGLRFKRDVVLGVIDDPSPVLKGERQRVAINRACDPLENEYGHGRLDWSAYLAGRHYQDVLEKASGCRGGGGQWREGDRVDAATAHDIAILRNLDVSNEAVKMLDETGPILGAHGERILRLALIDGKNFTEIAGMLRRCPPGKAGPQYVGYVFRQSCALLGDHWGMGVAVGPTSKKNRSWVDDRNAEIMEGAEPPVVE